MTELIKEVKKRSTALQWYHEHKEDSEFLKQRRTYCLNYYHTKKEIDEEYINNRKERDTNLYNKKKQDPEFAEAHRIRCREAMRIKRLKDKQAKENINK